MITWFCIKFALITVSLLVLIPFLSGSKLILDKKSYLQCLVGALALASIDLALWCFCDMHYADKGIVLFLLSAAVINTFASVFFSMALPNALNIRDVEVTFVAGAVVAIATAAIMHLPYVS